MDFGRPLIAEESLASRSKIRHLELPPRGADENEDARLDRWVLETANRVAREMLLGPPPYQPHVPETTTPTASPSCPDCDGTKAAEDNENDSSEEVEAMDNQTLDEENPPVPVHWIDASYFKEFSFSHPKQSTTTTIQPGDLVVIMEAFDRLDFVYVTPGEYFYNRNGHFRHDDFIGKPFGSMVRSSNHSGYGFVYLLKPTPELWARSLLHRTQIVQELDQVQIVAQLQLRPNMRVMESGTGSGAMSHAILRSIAPKGHLHTFEFHQQRAEVARKEFEAHGLSHLVTVAHHDVCCQETGFVGIEPLSMDACFLDLPEPWLAIPHAVYCLKSGARIASYSPCVEQTQRACQALQEAGCHSIRTYEFRLMEYYVDELEHDVLPTESRPLHDPDVCKEPNGRVASDDSYGDGGTEAPDAGSEAETQKVKGEKGSCAPPVLKKQRLVARPFNTMKGHTAFLTFATTGNRPRPNPLKRKEE